MTDKFLPFNPETAKNGDTVYYIGGSFWFVGINPKCPNECILIRPGGSPIIAVNSGVTIKAPKKTVWMNVYGDDLACYWYPTEKIAKDYADTASTWYIGTYPLEIDDVA